MTTNMLTRMCAKIVVFLPYVLVFGAAVLGLLYLITGLQIIETIFTIVVRGAFILTSISTLIYIFAEFIEGKGEGT